MTLRLNIALEVWPWSRSLRISGHVFAESQVVVATVSDGVHRGRGEAVGIFYKGDSPAGIAHQIETVRTDVEAGIGRDELRRALPPGGARNAIDCALWDLESNKTKTPVWELAKLGALKPLLTTHTLSADSPEAVAEGAFGKYRHARAIKLKLLGDGDDAARVRAVRDARADVWIGVDANQGFTTKTFAELLPALVEARVELVEQPFKIGEEHLLDGFESPIPLAADESVQSLEDLDALVGRFDVVNIKLDKCGGLTEALLMADRARQLGLRVMVGNMGGTSLAMVPALVVGQYCDIVDLDGPLFLATDRNPAVIYDDGYVSAPPGIWGWRA